MTERVEPQFYDGLDDGVGDWIRQQIADGVITQGAWSDGVLFGAAAAGEIVSISVAHAVALERERIATWLESITIRDKQQWIEGISEPMTAVMYDGTPAEFVDAIRNGEHHNGDTPVQ